MIRKLKPTELSSVMQIWLEANLEAHNFVNAEYWHSHSEEVRKMLMTSEIYVYEDEAEQKVTAFIGLIDHFIGGLFVHRAYRSTGIGKELIDYVKTFKAYLVLHVFQKNEAAFRFYQREGFLVNQTLSDDSTGEKTYEMVWEK